MEYFKYGDLQSHMSTRIPEVQSKIIAAQLLQGLKIMHQEKFTHRDLKPQNIFVVQMQPYFWVKIGDFGITKRITNDQTILKTEIGTLDYLAPEILGYVDEETSQYTNSVDIWSLGCVCHRLLTMNPPFPKLSALAAYCRGASLLPIEPNDSTTMDESTVCVQAVDFVKALMRPLPEERISADEALYHPWLEDVDTLEAALVASVAERPSEPAAVRPTSALVNRPRSMASEGSEVSADGVSKQMGSEKLESRFGALTLQQANLSTLSTKKATAIGQRSQANLLRDAESQQMPSIVTQSPKPHLISTSIVRNERPMPLTTSHGQPRGSWAIARRTPPLLQLESRALEIIQHFRRGGFNIQEIMVQGPELRMRDAFEWAADQADKLYIEYLLNSGAQIRDPSRSLRWAAASGIPSAVQCFLKRGADINSPSNRGFTALHNACRCRHTDVVRLLLQSGADVHARTNEGMTALHCAPTDDKTRSGPITSLLLEYGASAIADVKDQGVQLASAAGPLEQERDNQPDQDWPVNTPNSEEETRPALGTSAVTTAQQMHTVEQYAGISGAAKRVMDFFRRRGNARTDERT